MIWICVNESVTDRGECCKKVANERTVESAIISLKNAWSLRLECAKVLYESLLVLVLMHVKGTKVRSEKERSRVRVEQMDNLGGLVGIRRIEILPNAWVGELCGLKKGREG